MIDTGHLEVAAEVDHGALAGDGNKVQLGRSLEVDGVVDVAAWRSVAAVDAEDRPLLVVPSDMAASLEAQSKMARVELGAKLVVASSPDQPSHWEPVST